MSLETPKTFTLITPIQAGDVEVTELILREPTAGDIEKLQADQEKHGAATALILLIAKQTKVAAVDVRKVSARDFNKLSGYLGSFLESGEKSSES